MPGVSRDQIERARKVDVLDYVLRHEPNNVKRVGSAYRMKDHPSIEIKSGRWRWYSQGLYGKTALDYLINVRGYGFVDAVCHLLGEWAQGYERTYKPVLKARKTNVTPEPKTELVRIPLALPLHHKNNERIIAYLQSRGIDKGLIMDCIRRGDLYESAYKHECVFKGKDDNGKTQYAAIRSTTSSFKGDAEGSNKKYCFLIQPADPESSTAAIFEAPVDALSHQTMSLYGYIPQFDGWRISLGGTSTIGLSHFLETHPQVGHCVICTDYDEAGNRVAEQIAELEGITTERSIPIHGTDWNDALEIVQKAQRTHNRAISFARDERR